VITAAAHAHHFNPAAVVLVVIGLLALWVGSLYHWPFGPCPRCGGSGLNRGSSRKRFGECPRCRGRRRVQRRGSRTVHRLAATIRGEVGRQRQARRGELAARRAEHPRRLNDE
jgi:hypothetical protein